MLFSGQTHNQMRHERDSNVRSSFNEIRIDLRANGLNNSPYPTGNDQRPLSSIPTRVSKYSEYPQVHPTNPLYLSQAIAKIQRSNPPSSNSRSSATLVNRCQKFDPQAPRRPSDWRFLSVLCIILFFPLGIFAYAFAHKAQNNFRNGFITDAHNFNKRALVLCISSIITGIGIIVGLLFIFDAWPRTNG